MLKVNVKDVPELSWTSPKGKFVGAGRQVSEALGRDPESTDLMRRHPFDVEILRIPAGKSPYPYHSHSAQWEFYYVLSGSGTVRDPDGTTPISAGDAFLFQPGQAHQLSADASGDLTIVVVADNPFGESTHQPDSNKYVVRSPARAFVQPVALTNYDGEE